MICPTIMLSIIDITVLALFCNLSVAWTAWRLKEPGGSKPSTVSCTANTWRMLRMLGFAKASQDIESARLTFNTFQHCRLCKNAVFPAKGCFKMVLHRHVASQLIHSDPWSIHIMLHIILHIAHQHSCSMMAAITVTSALLESMLSI